jgi:L-alanine-DL-glutamate epimerase-like enolase superfamily enzyme
VRSDIRIVDVSTFIVETHPRTPIKFGSVIIEELPFAVARVTVENRAGQVAQGWGGMFLVDLWAWPVSQASHAAKSATMRQLFRAWGQVLTGFKQPAHPIDIFMETGDDLARLGRTICAELTPGEQLPHLGALICASPFDHAIHDAFGHVNGIDSYLGYGPEFMRFDLARYLGSSFQHLYPAHFLRQAYLPTVPIFHLIGGLDALRKDEIGENVRPTDLPNSLDQWIERDGVFCLKIKLRGSDLAWDIHRTLEVSRVYHETRKTRRRDLPERPFLTLDANEQCESPEYMIEYLRRLEKQAPDVFDEILYLEQPTERDLTAHRWDMRLVAKYKPVLIDEGLASIDDFDLAIELGWSGVALKSCKCLSLDLLLVAKAELAGLPYAIQDLTNPSLALIQSVGLAARTHPIKGVEANSRQFFVEVNAPAASAHPGLYAMRDGLARTRSITGTGLGLQVERMVGFAELLEIG